MSKIQDLLGKYVLVRTNTAGVHCGILSERNGQECLLTDTRRIWYWEGAFTLSAIANFGLDVEVSKLSIVLPEILLLEAVEIIPCSQKATDILQSCPAHGSPKQDEQALFF